MRLYCFAHAGAGASAFAAWATAAPDDIEIVAIQLPGRETRIAEPPLRSFAPAARAVSAAICASADRRLALFGHSAGARLALQVAAHLEDAGSPPDHIFLSGADDRVRAPIHGLPGGAFRRSIRERYGNLPAQLTEDPTVWKVYERALRADFEAIETAARTPRRLAAPITVMFGNRDTVVDGNPEGWQAWSQQAIRYEVIDADHYSYRTAPLPYLRVVVRHLFGRLL